MSAVGVLDAVRFSRDGELAAELGESIGSKSSLADASFAEHQKNVRKKLLATAVRVDPRMLPNLDRSIQTMRERAQFTSHVEAYVFEDPSINAFLTTGIKHTYLGLSSGAVNNLSEAELSFVIGHELGHAYFGHADSSLTGRLEDDDLEIESKRKILAWKRACEITADRCGLVCCPSIDVAATALFRSISGLTARELSIHPDDFSEQWDHLLAEVISHGGDNLWQATHPYPPVRMKALVMFWQSDCAALPGNRPQMDLPLEQVNKDVTRLLATLDPDARARQGAADPLLEDIVLWSNLTVAHAGPNVHAGILNGLRMKLPAAMAAHGEDSQMSEGDCLEHLKASLGLRQRKLKPLEIHRILKSVLGICASQEGFAKDASNAYWQAFCRVGEVFGIDKDGCEVVFERSQQ